MIGREILDGEWHNIMVAVGGDVGVAFYYDGNPIGTNRFAFFILLSIHLNFVSPFCGISIVQNVFSYRSARFSEIIDDEGDLYLGASAPNVSQFEGVLQDVKIFTKTLLGR